MAKLFQLVVQDTRLALTTVSVFCGALSIFLVILIPTTHNHRRAGFMAGLLLLFLPGFWLHSEIALSDIPGIAFTLLSVVFLLSVRHQNATRYIILGTFFAGLSLGVRPHNVIPIVLAGILALYDMRPLNLGFARNFLLAVVAGFIGITIWLIPIYQTFDGFQGYHGFDGYLQRLENHRLHIQSSDSLFQQELTSATFKRRIDDYIDGWTHLLAGHNKTILLMMSGLMLVGIIKLPFKQRFTWFLLIWFIAEALKIFLLASLERPRLYLPALIPLIILVALGYSRWQNRYRLLQIGFIALICLSLSTALPIVLQLNQFYPPPEQATTYILNTYPLSAGTALVVSQGSFQSAQYHLSDYKQLYTPYFDADVWANTVAYDQPDHLIILDGDDIAPEIFDALTSRLHYITIDDTTFERDPRVFLQHSTVRVQIMVQEKDLKADQLVLPESGIISTSSTEDSKYFSSGWYRIEDIGGTMARWTNQVAVLRISLPAHDTIMKFVATPFLGGQSVEIAVNGTVLDIIDINDIWETYQLTIPASAIADHNISTIEFRHKLAEYPEHHNRRLATAYREFYFE